MTQVFGAEYASIYDTFYREKDYTLECDHIEALTGAAQRILDLGCGTGGHAALLARRGHAVTGVDRSADMIEIAQRKARSMTMPNPVDFRVADIRTSRIGQSFDAVIMMFAVLGYQITDSDIMATLRTARTHLKPGGRLLCDFWYGPAVLAQRPSARTRYIDTPGGRITRTASSCMDTDRRVCTVNISWQGPGTREARTEQHTMRYFFHDELESFLGGAGFELLRLGAWPETEMPADESTWNAYLLALAT